VTRALIFDVDGTLAETEEIHRISFNKAFMFAGLNWHWDKACYAQLLSTTGGKERIARFVEEQHIVPISTEAIRRLHLAKNQFYAETVAQGGLQLRPGVARVIKDAQDAGLKLGIATTTSRSNLDALLQCCFGFEGDRMFDAIVCGEDVQRKKPDPEVYDLCLARLGIEPTAALAFEDSGVGLRAALAAGIQTVVTPNSYTKYDDFTGAHQVLPDLKSWGKAKILMPLSLEK
jgi:HAD superfamily hydrolase (TIGR01509 family)